MDLNANTNVTLLRFITGEILYSPEKMSDITGKIGRSEDQFIPLEIADTEVEAQQGTTRPSNLNTRWIVEVRKAHLEA